MKCPSCGAEIPDNSKFCPECGNKIEITQTSVEIVPIEVTPVTSNTTSVNQPIKKHHKIKKLWLVISLAVLIVGGTTTGIILHQQQEKAYQQHLVDVEKQKKTAYNTKLTSTVADLIVQTYASESACQIISQKWHDAIFSDFGEDFNTAIANAENILKTSELGQNMTSGNTKIQNEMKNLQNPYKGYENTYQLVLQLNNEYTGLYNQATNPTGTLITYNSDISSKEDSFNTTLNQITVVMPDVKSKINK